jgi:hypothetical protein
MPSMKLVRCIIQPRGGAIVASPRFVPLEIFGLWEYLMTTKHGFEVKEAQASLWLDMEESPEVAYDDHPHERVTEVSAFIYSRRDDMLTRACRYFRSEDCERLTSIFLSHYPDDASQRPTQLRERPGIWVYRQPVEAGRQA